MKGTKEKSNKGKATPVAIAANKAVEARAADLKSVMLKSLGPVQPGLFIVAMSDAALLTMVRGAFERQLGLGLSATGMVFPKATSVLSLYAGAKRKAVEAQVFASAHRITEKASEHVFQSMGTRDGFDWCGDEGLCALLPLVERGRGWLTMSQAVRDGTDANLVDAFSRIRASAIRAKAFVMLFLTTNQRKPEVRFQDFTDGYFVVDRCEQEPGAFLTFSANCVGLSDLHDLGIGNSMCSAKFDGSRYSWRWEQYISSKVIDRVIWKLRCEGRPLSSIANIVGLDKSNVHRHLSALPAQRGASFDRGWLKEYADLLDLERIAAPPAESLPDVADDEEEPTD